MALLKRKEFEVYGLKVITIPRTQIHKKSDFISFITYGHLPQNYIRFFLLIHRTINLNLHCSVNYNYFLQECLQKELLPSEEILMGKGV